MKTYRERLAASTLDIEEVWEMFLDLEIEEGRELKQASDLLKSTGASADVKRDLMERVRVQILGWDPRD